MRKSLHSIRFVASAASLLLFFYMLRHTGTATILDSARALGGGFAFLILLSGMKQVLRSVAWQNCMPPNTIRPPLIELFGLRLVGEAFSGITPAGPLLGESVKIWAASKHMPVLSSASSVAIEDITYALAVTLFMLSGIVLLLFEVTISPPARLLTGALFVCMLLSVAVPYWVLRRDRFFISRLLDRLQQAPWANRFLEQYGTQLLALESEVYDFFWTRKDVFLYILAVELLTNFTGVAEAYLILKVTAAHASLLAAYLVEAANRAIRLSFAFVPFGLGIDEGAAAATLRGLGYAAGNGVSLAILRKTRTIVWAAIGLLVAAKYSIFRRAQERSVT